MKRFLIMHVFYRICLARKHREKRICREKKSKKNWKKLDNWKYMRTQQWQLNIARKIQSRGNQANGIDKKQHCGNSNTKRRMTWFELDTNTTLFVNPRAEHDCKAATVFCLMQWLYTDPEHCEYLFTSNWSLSSPTMNRSIWQRIQAVDIYRQVFWLY